MKQFQLGKKGGGYDFVLSKNRSPQKLLPSKFVTNGIDVDHARFYCFVPHLVRSSFMIASGVFWCLQIAPLSTLLPAAVDTVFILFIWQTTAVGNEATSNTSLDRPRSG